MGDRNKGQKVFRIGLAHWPVHARFVRCRVSEHSESAFNEVSKAPLFALLAIGKKSIYREHGRTTAQGTVNEGRAIVG
jgi:hypothetical protein